MGAFSTPSQCGKRIWTSSLQGSSRVSSATRCDLDFAHQLQRYIAILQRLILLGLCLRDKWQCRSSHTTGHSLGCSAKRATSVSTPDACTSGSSSPASQIVPTVSHPGRRRTGATNGVQRLYILSHECTTELSRHSQIRCIDANEEEMRDALNCGSYIVWFHVLAYWHITMCLPS